MRSRWSAYSVGASDYIIATTDPHGPLYRADTARWREEIAAFSATTRFEKLVIRELGPVREHRGIVEFFAQLSRDGRDVSFTERSRFVERDGRWLYHSGESVDDPG